MVPPEREVLPRKVEVIWLDATFEFDTQTAGSPGVTYTVGYEIEPRFRAHTSVAAEHTQEGWRAVTSIPNVNVVRVTELKGQ